ncbi:MAG: addiction module protein [Candidatus Sumerlaeaceae bacterium]
MKHVGLDRITSQALTLPAADRALLAERLVTSLSETADPDVEGQWIAEIRERYATYQRGELRTIDAEEVFRKLADDRQ